MNISIYGHAFVNVYTFTKNGTYREEVLFGGALMLVAANHVSFLQSEGPQMTISSENVEGYDKVCRREYYAVKKHEDLHNKEYYAISHYLGCRESKSVDNIYTLPANHLDEPADLVVWDEGYGGLKLPENYRSVLWASNKALPDREQFTKKCLLFLDADVLRSAGAMISRQISWEHSVSDLVWELQNNEAISYLMKARNILISFAEDGAVYINNTGKTPEVSLILTHGNAEGSLREGVYGSVNHTFLYMTLVLCSSSKLNFSHFDETLSPELIREALTAGAGIMSSGYYFNDEGGINVTLERVGKNWPAFDVPLVYNEISNQIEVKHNWTIANNVGDKKRLFDIAFEYVLKGTDVIDGLPQLNFGPLTTIDRWEIEAYQDIRNLIISYASGEELRPLSVAVFGAPGSGKSFGVTQIAKNILPGKIEKLEFNVSQFTNLTDLANAFQRVRDVILGGKLPIVFFDEFDSDRDGIRLGWLKSFLMPMQDGMFKDESGNHPLGKCILVFAGGTSSSFEEFTTASEHFKNVKGPDFISRLRGTINVLGPNPKNEDDSNYLLRRALLLRTICERKLDMKKHPAPVNESIIRAMLLIPEYKHGTRSMEAIFNMSRIDSGVWEPVSLPSRSQLSLHVDADTFIKLVINV
ncbi:MAG: AAA family ATPase [Defluviitaleaceae bacterium]|nr:AAA family ATPase [Defluviitaleaceae bacterium]